MIACDVSPVAMFVSYCLLELLSLLSRFETFSNPASLTFNLTAMKLGTKEVNVRNFTLIQKNDTKYKSITFLQAKIW